MLTLSGTLTCACPAFVNGQGMCIRALLGLSSKVALKCFEVFCRACSYWACFASAHVLPVCFAHVVSRSWVRTGGYEPSPVWKVSSLSGQTKSAVFLYSGYSQSIWFFSPATLSAFSNHKKLLMAELRRRRTRDRRNLRTALSERLQNGALHGLTGTSCTVLSSVYNHVCFRFMNVLCHIISYVY